MIYLHYRQGSSGGRELIRKLRELGAQASRLREGSVLSPGDKIIGWGSPIHARIPDGVLALNATLPPSKLAEIRQLSEEGVPIPEVRFTTPPTAALWIGRRAHHSEGRDFDDPPEHPDFWTRRVNFEEEYRIHIFRGHSIRAALKTDDPAFPGGYRYTGCPHTRLRRAAIKAVRALDLDFGAVDVARLSNGRACVFEVNTKPGLGGGTTEIYARRIMEVA